MYLVPNMYNLRWLRSRCFFMVCVSPFADLEPVFSSVADISVQTNAYGNAFRAANIISQYITTV